MNDYYGTQPPFDDSSQKELVVGETEMGRPSIGQHPGPEGRHEMFNAKDAPAAHELYGGNAHELPGRDADKESR